MWLPCDGLVTVGWSLCGVYGHGYQDSISIRRSNTHTGDPDYLGACCPLGFAIYYLGHLGDSGCWIPWTHGYNFYQLWLAKLLPLVRYCNDSLIICTSISCLDSSSCHGCGDCVPRRSSTLTWACLTTVTFCAGSWFLVCLDFTSYRWLLPRFMK